MHTSFQDPNFHSYEQTTKSGLQHHISISSLIIWENVMLLSMEVIPFIFPTILYKSAKFSVCLPILFVLFKTYVDNFNRCKIISLCNFDLHFIISDVEHLFIYILVIWIYSLEKPKAFLLRLETKQKCPLSPLLSYILLKVVDWAMSKKKKQRHLGWKGRSKIICLSIIRPYM